MDYSLDPDGSVLHWSSLDVHLGASELLQAVDPLLGGRLWKLSEKF